MNPDSKPCCPIFYAPLVLQCFPDLLEQNRVMEFLGKNGCVSPRNLTARRIIMLLALASTIVGWAFLIFADFAISTQYRFIDMAPYNYASVGFAVNDPTFRTPIM